MLQTQAEPVPPAFENGERLLLWSLRRCAFACGDTRVVVHTLRDAVGENGGTRTHIALRRLLHQLARHGRRQLRLGPPCAAHVTADERQILQAIAAAQWAIPGRAALHLAWLLPRASQPQSRALVQTIAEAMADGGCRLSYQAGPCAEAR